MSHNQGNPGDTKTSRKAIIITTVILLCLLLAGGAFLLLTKSPSAGSSGQKERSIEPGAPSETLPGQAREWLGIDTILSILNIGNGYSVVKADPSSVSVETVASSGKTGKDGTDASASESTAQTDSGASADSNTDSKTGKTGTDASADESASQTDSGASPDSKTGKPVSDVYADESAAQSKTDISAGNTSDQTQTPEKTAEKTVDKTAEKKDNKEEKKDKKSTSPTKLQKKYVSAWEEWHMRDFPGNYPLHNYNWKYLEYNERGLPVYEGDENYMIRLGIDVSEFQGKIDWEKVKEAGFDFVFVRVGHRTMHTGDLQRDVRAIKNLTRAKEAGLDVGAYVFSQAITKKEAREEAQLCLDVIEESGVELTLPIVFDPEIVIEDYYARINFISGEQFTDNAVAFCEKIRKAGYTPAIYANCSTETDILDMSRLQDTIIWYADYSLTPETPYDFTFWQYSDEGWVDGIPETATDLNAWFIKK